MPVCGRRKEPAALATALRRTTLAPELRRPRNPTITCDYWGSQAMSRHRGAWFHAARSRNPQEHNVDAETSRNSIPQPIERRDPEGAKGGPKKKPNPHPAPHRAGRADRLARSARLAGRDRENRRIEAH